MNKVLGNILLIISFILLAFGKNDMDWCFFVKILIFAILVHIISLDHKETFGVDCYPRSVRAPVMVSFKSNSKD